MSEKDREDRPQRDILEELRQQGRFYEFLFVSWGIVEFRANESILKVHGLSSQNPKDKPLLDLSVGKQLELFKKIGCLSAKDYQTVLEFKNKRNNLFHTGGLFIRALSEREKEEIMDLGMLTADVMHNLSESIKHSIFELDDIETGMNEEEEFEKNRKIVLQNCNSNIQNHMGYLIAVIIGSLTLVSQWKSFFSSGNMPRIGFYVLFDLIFIVSFYVVGRMLYWTFLDSFIMNMVYSDLTSNGSQQRHSKLWLILNLAGHNIQNEMDRTLGLWLAKTFFKGINKRSSFILCLLFFPIWGAFLYIDSVYFKNPLETCVSYLMMLLGSISFVSYS